MIRRWRDVAAFRARAGDWLLAAEAEHNLLLGILSQVESGDHGFEVPLYFATLEEGDAVVGCAFRTPPFKLGLTRMPLAAVAEVADDVAAVFDALPAVLGPPDVAARFAGHWSARTGVPARPGMRQRIFSLERVVPPRRPPAGGLSVATSAELPLLRGWAAAFAREAGVAGGDTDALVRRLAARGELFVWRDTEPCAMAASMASTPHGARLGFVYTPPDRRGRGYASALTAAASRRVLDAGRRFCVLYTDLANPTSNAIYQRIGYRPVADVAEWLLSSPDRDPA